MKLPILLTGVIILGTTLTSTAYAAGSSECQVIYGGGEVCPQNIPFSVDKQIARPGTTSFVDNLQMSDPKYKVNDTVVFRITVKNNGRSKIDKLTVADTLPEDLRFESGPGNYNDTRKIVTYTIENLEAGKTKTETIKAKVNMFTSNDAIKCVSNAVRVLDPKGVNVNDASAFCMERQATTSAPNPQSQGPQVVAAPNTKQMPPTGPETIIFPLLTGAGALGLFLRKKA